MAPSYPTTTSSPVSTTPTATLFEGAEKKLQLGFAPAAHPESETNHFSLRSLSRHQVDTITDAAKCTILSVVSNESIDAYLLSESSLFISPFELVIKTCGTTTLLQALPTIIRLASSVGLILIQLTFTRVAYLFPDEQPFPHNSFENEAAYLDDILKCHGHVTRHTTSVSSEWYAYSAKLEPSTTFDVNVFPHYLPSSSKQNLEICMFDLDPHVMNRFLFHNEPSRIGTDLLVGGTTECAGISSLLFGADVVDAFNFDPCGYSMNAITPSGGFYTIHVTPEEGGSYVSFEAKVENAISANLIASVVDTFRPGRLTVSMLSSSDLKPDRCENISDSLVIDEYSSDFSLDTFLPFEWDVVTKLLQPRYRSVSDPHFERLNPSGYNSSTMAVVAAFTTSDPVTCTNFESGIDKTANINWTDVSSNSSGGSNGKENFMEAANISLYDVARGCGAVSVSRDIKNALIDFSTVIYNGSENVNTDEMERAWPVLVIDLNQIVNNYLTLKKKEMKKNDIWGVDVVEQCEANISFRFVVRCCFDEHVLRLLASLPDVTFEIGDAMEINTLQNIGVSRERIVLATTFMTKSHFCLLEHVSKVVLHSVPDDMIMRAIRVAGVGVEVMMTVANVDEGVELVRDISDGCGTMVSSIGLENSGLNDPKMLYGIRDGLMDLFRKAPALKVNETYDHGDIGTIVDISESLMGDGALNMILTVIGRRVRGREGRCDLFLNDGIYGTLAAIGLRGQVKHAKLNVKPRGLMEGRSNTVTKHNTTLWGPTCDATDRIWDGDLIDLDIGQHVVFDDVGPFVLNFISTFNGFATKIKTAYVV